MDRYRNENDIDDVVALMEYGTSINLFANNKQFNGFLFTGYGRKRENTVNPEDIIDAEFREKPDTEESPTNTILSGEGGEYYLKQVRQAMAEAEKRQWRKTETYRHGWRGINRRVSNLDHMVHRNKSVRNKNQPDKRVMDKSKRNKIRAVASDGVRRKVKSPVLGRKSKKKAKEKKKGKVRANALIDRASNIKNSYIQVHGDKGIFAYAPSNINMNKQEEEEWWIVPPARKSAARKTHRRKGRAKTPKRIYISLRRRVYRFTRKYKDRVYIKQHKKKMRRLFRMLNVATYKQRLYLHTRWMSWLLRSTKYTMDKLNKYAGALSTVRATMDRYFYKKITFANIVVKNTYMNTFLTLMYKGRRVIYQQTAGQLDIYRKIRRKTFVGFVLGKTLVGLLDRLRRKNRFNIVHIVMRGLRIYNNRIHEKLCGYRRYLLKSLRYFNYIYTGLEMKKARIILKIFPKPFKWTNTQQQHYNHMKGQCRYFASRYYHIASLIRKSKKPFNGCRGLKLRSERSSQGLK